MKHHETLKNPANLEKRKTKKTFQKQPAILWASKWSKFPRA